QRRPGTAILTRGNRSGSDLTPDFLLRMGLIALHDLLEVSDSFGQTVQRAGDAAKLIVSNQLVSVDLDRALKALAGLIQFAALLMNQAQIVMRGRITRIDRCGFQ